MRSIQKGIKASEGITIGKVVSLYKKHDVCQDAHIEQTTIDDNEKESHLNLFKKAIEQSTKELSLLAETDDIFAAQIEMVNDPMLIESVETYIDTNLSALSALRKTRDDLVDLFENIDDGYLKERVSDVKDICKRISNNLSGKKERLGKVDIEDGSIIVAEELLPSDTYKINMSKVAGFITAKGGSTSHFSIIIRNRAIPAIVGFGDEAEQLQDGDLIILDACETRVIINPDQKTILLYEEKIALEKEELEELDYLKEIKIVTSSGEKINILANAGSVDEVKLAISKGAEGIGIFRSEFMFMVSTNFPTEEEQFNIYKDAVLACMGYPLVIRTLDIGSDKDLAYYKMEAEENPALGMRAIRFSFYREDIFKTQLRAILRASAFGDIKIMLPMIISTDELERAIELINECKTELADKSQSFNAEIETGIMIETPASVFIADELIKLCDFFSIGTNDLTQYILAVDRSSINIGHLYNPMHPAVLNAMQKVICTARKHDKAISMCGDLASDPKSMETLLAMGLTNYSVSIDSLLKVKKKIYSLSS